MATNTRTKVEPGIYRTPSGAYLVRTPKQRGSTKTVDVTFERLADARAFKATAAATRAAGDVVQAPKRGTNSPVPTLAAYAADWLAQRRRKTAATDPEASRKRGGSARPETLDGYEITVRRLMVPLHGLLVSEIDRSSVEDLAIWLAEQGYAETTANEALRLLVTLLEAAPERFMPGRNPARGVRAVAPAAPKMARATKRKRALTLAEVERWASCLPMEHRAALWLSSLAGLRTGEICGLKLRQLDLEAGTVEVLRQRRQVGNAVKDLEYVKTSASYRTLPLAPVLVDFLRWYVATFHGIDPADPQHGDRLLLLAHRGGPASVGSLSYVLAAGRDRAGLGPQDLGWRLTLHHLRKTLGGLLEASGAVTGRLVSDYLGHETVARTEVELADRAADVTLDVYTPSLGTLEQLRRVAAVIDQLVAAAGIDLIGQFDARPNVAQAAEQLGLGGAMVRLLIKTGVLEAERVVPAENRVVQWRIEQASLDAELARRGLIAS